MQRRQRRKERLQPKIIRLQNRIELVIMTAGAPHAQSEEHIPGYIGEFIFHLRQLPWHVSIVVFINSRAQITGCNDCVIVLRPHLIASQLLLHKAIA